MTLRPLRNHVLVKETDVQPSKIIVLTDPPKTCKGTVVSVGPKVIDLKPGHRVWFKFHCGQQYKLVDGMHRMIPEPLIEGILHE